MENKQFFSIIQSLDNGLDQFGVSLPEQAGQAAPITDAGPLSCTLECYVDRTRFDSQNAAYFFRSEACGYKSEAFPLASRQIAQIVRFTHNGLCCLILPKGQHELLPVPWTPS